MREHAREDARETRVAIDEIDKHVGSLAERLARIETLVTTPMSFVDDQHPTLMSRVKKHAPAGMGAAAVVAVLIDHLPKLLEIIK